MLICPSSIERTTAPEMTCIQDIREPSKMSTPCRFVAMRCAGFDRVDLKACEKAGIVVARVPTYSPSSVAEHAAAMLMCLNRSLPIS